MEELTQQREICGISYFFVRKKVKNINLRVHRDATVHVSAPMRCAVQKVDAFVCQRAAWIAKAQQTMLERETQYLVPCTVSAQDALALFEQVSAEIFPLFATVLHGKRPVLKVRSMKTRWGVCKVSALQITLSLRLAQQPRAAVEYVMLHEYAHFVQPNHSPAFWAVVQQLMPDYKARKALLR